MDKTKRFFEIDFLRAISIFLMTITHVNSVYYRGDNPVLEMFTTLGSTVCFSIFLFCSAYISGIRIEQGKDDPLMKVLTRIFRIYIVYFVLAILIQYAQTRSLSIQTVVDISIFKLVPEFADFLIAFILFSFLAKIFFKPFQYLQQKPFLLLSISILLFVISQQIYPYISQMSFPTGIQILVENVIGYQQLHRFPITFYFIIFSLGIVLSKENSTTSIRYTFLISTLLVFLLRLFDISQWERWPPSILFLTYGISFISLTLLLTRMFDLKNKLLTLFSNTGRYPLDQLFLSTLMIFLLFLVIGGEKTAFQTVILNISILLVLFLHPIVVHRKWYN